MAKQKKSEQAKLRLEKVKFEAESQMQRLQEAAEKKTEELQKQIKDAEEAAEKALQEELLIYENTVKSIKDTAKANGFFCGLILTKKDITAIVEAALDSNTNIKIEFALYPEAEDSTDEVSPTVKETVKDKDNEVEE